MALTVRQPSAAAYDVLHRCGPNSQGAALRPQFLYTCRYDIFPR